MPDRLYFTINHYNHKHKYEENMKAIKRTMLRIAALTLAGCAVMGMAGCGSSSSSGANTVNSATGPTIDPSGKRVAVSENAIAIFEEATKQAKTDPKAAIDTFKKAAKAQNNFAEAYYNIGLLEQKLGNKSDARDAYETALKMRPNLSAAQTNLAKMLIDEGKTDEAEAALLKIIDEKTGTDPYNVEANLNLGMIYRKRGEDILEKERGGSEPKFSMTGSENRGEIKNKDAYNMFAKSISYVRRALASDSNNIYCYENLAAVYYAMNSLEVARLVIEQASIKYEEYNNLYDKYTTVDLAICMRRNEAVQEDKHTKARIHELHVKDEESGRKQWSDFDALLAYYGRSDVNYEQLQQLIEENNAERSAYGNLVRGIESKAGETREMGFDFMCLGSALAVIGLIRILRDLQLLGRFSQKPKYSIC